MEGLLNELIQSLGYIGVFILMLFFATELVMPLAGFWALSTGMWLPGVVLAGALGSTAGSMVIYYGGRFVPSATVHRLSSRYGRFIGISAANTKRAEWWFDRHARATVLWSKFAPGIRSASSFVAGYRHMHLGWFIVCTAAATIASSLIMATAGFLIGDNIETLQWALSKVSTAVWVLLLAAIAGFFIYRRKRYGKLLDKRARRKI